jgi:hypothetical protein
MDYLMYLYTAAVVIAAALASIAVWTPRKLWLKLSALALSGLLMATAYSGLVNLLGRPKPANLEWVLATVPDATVLGATMREREAIYLWLKFEDNPEPLSYALPWNLEMAKELQKAMRQAKGNGTKVRMRKPFDRSLERAEPMFYAEPQKALPLKEPVNS